MLEIFICEFQVGLGECGSRSLSFTDKRELNDLVNVYSSIPETTLPGFPIIQNQYHLHYKTARGKQCIHNGENFIVSWERCKDDLAVFPKADTNTRSC